MNQFKRLRRPSPSAAPQPPFKVPLRAALTIPFFAQLVLIVSVVGYVSFRNGKSAADAIMRDFGKNTADTVDEHLRSYLQTPPHINLVTQGLITQELLSTEEPDRLSQYFWQQLHHHESLRFLYLGTAQGGYIGATRESEATIGLPGTVSVDLTPTLGAGLIHTYRTDDQGQPIELLQVIESPYDARQRPWFQAAVADAKASWSEVFASFYDPILGIAAYQPMYGEGEELLGVLGAELDLAHLSTYLNSLAVGASGAVFLAEPNGLLVAASDGTPLFTQDATTEELQRLTAAQSQSSLLQAIAPQLFVTESPLANRPPPSPDAWPLVMPLRVEGQVYSVYVQPLADMPGLDWWVIVILAESDFLADFRVNAGYTVLLCVLIVLLALWFTLWIAHWLSAPIHALNQASQSVTNEQFELPTIHTPIQELAELSQRFQQMAVAVDTSLEDLRDRFHAAFESAAVGMALVDMTGQTIAVNEALAEMLGYTSAELLNMKPQDIVHPEDWLRTAPFREQLQQGEIQTYSLERRYCHRQGYIVWGLFHMSLVRDRRHQPVYFFSQVQDITARKATELALQNTTQRLEAWANTIPGHIFSLRIQPDGEHVFDYSNHYIEVITEIPREQWLANPDLARVLIHPEDLADYEAALVRSRETQQPFEHEWRIITPSGKLKWVQGKSHLSQHQNGEKVWHGILMDITARKQLESQLQASNQELEHLAHLDGLTQLANRRRFDDYLAQVWKLMQRDQNWLSLVMIDVDYFKRYNDYYGHPQGDRCLQAVAQVLQQTVQRSGDLVARYGGEEFVLVLPYTHETGATALVQQIQQRLQARALPHEDSPIAPQITLSFGIVTCQPARHDTPTELVQRVDQLLYKAKHQGRNCWVQMSLS
ncbi:diguanylate cyclase domain-containing protein [Halomicronema sp. CCY15110]|uniref:diguanylate cyclase domain-containing protein n=1 Tax=Halomicronema sp. CCY15110 TaxID=2767773 RepID=UPI00194DD4B8|nr:diguanylate cyclase [Halomicronema sp. CCY15110]